MKKSTQSTQQKGKKENQLVFLEYEKPTANGHFMTIMDSYRNIIGRVNKSFNDQTMKYEYAAYDHAGNPFTKGEKISQVKSEFINNREELLENAHQRRIASKEKSKQMSNEKSLSMQKPDRTKERKNEIEKLRGKTGTEKQNEKSFSNRSLNSNEKVFDNKTYKSIDYNLDEEESRREIKRVLNILRNGRDQNKDERNLDR
ncbi:MAG TPA: hypothetical protein VJY62_22010 [Bacteroidia bacterium]|nr:hypothetical protein [Bacteroidia bacterium]